MCDLLAQGEQEGGGGGATQLLRSGLGRSTGEGRCITALYTSHQHDHDMAGHTCCRYGLAAFLQAGWYEQQGQDNHMEK